VIDRLSADFLIVGSGIAGLRAAIALQTSGRVLILTKSDLRAGSTGYAQGGIAAAVGADDSPDRHLADTLAAGDGLCDEAAVRVLVEEGPAYVGELLSWGAAFDRKPDGALDLTREAAHSVRRVLHAADATGREIGRVLASRLAGPDSVTVIDHATVVSVIVQDGRAIGARFLNRDGQTIDAYAAATLLATGGAGQVYRETTNPAVAAGDGVALGFLAGARVADLEFVQFHPTALAVPGAPRYLLSEALRGEGGRLVNDAGEAFMTRYDPAGDLAPRDRVARATVLESERTGKPIYLTMAHLPAASVRARFPLITMLCQRVGLDLATDRLPVGPAAHYLMGGVATDLDGRTSLPGLFAAGEVACTGVHGANRLASNSLLEGLVFGGRAGAAMASERAVAPARDNPPAGAAGIDVALPDTDIATAMWKDVGVFRSREGLERALAMLEPGWAAVERGLADGRSFDLASWRLAALATVGRLIARAALAREESRGAHWRADFPARDDLHWKRRREETRPAR
jgi:L-aspartate oxidase